MEQNKQLNTEQKKNYFPTICALYPDHKGNFNSFPLTAEQFDTLQKSVSIGFTIRAKVSPKQTRTGKDYFFLEVLPPLEKTQERSTRAVNTAKNTKANSRTESEEDV